MSISIQGLSYRYGSRMALDGVDIDVASGNVAALLGSNGQESRLCSRFFVDSCGLSREAFV